MQRKIYHDIVAKSNMGKKQLCLLIDPDKYSIEKLCSSLAIANQSVNYIFVGGSLLVEKRVSDCMHIIKDNTDLPVVLFPGSPAQIHESADALLFLSLISGRNPDLLIGRHVEAAPILKRTTLEVIPTGYILIDGGAPTTASYISNTLPIPANKPEIAACTAMAGELLGLKLIYLDSGSGAENTIPQEVISAVKESTELPVIVGGGIRSVKQLSQAAIAGADLLVTGNAIETDPELLYYFAEVINAPA